MVTAVTATILSVVLVSLVSLVGVFSLGFYKKVLSKSLMFMVSLSAGTLFGGAFLHLLPEAIGDNTFTTQTALLVLSGIVVFFILEKIIHMHHHHHDHESTPKKNENLSSHIHHDKPKHVGILNLVGDGVHNFLDGLIIAGSFLINIPAGIATTIAVVLHEVPQEIADYGVLLYAGFSKPKALLFNFLSGTISIVGAIVGLSFAGQAEQFLTIIIPFAAGGFIYIAGSNLIPELHKHIKLKESLLHLLFMLIGILIMYGLLFLE
jgi:zinc and cadmium transporter